MSNLQEATSMWKSRKVTYQPTLPSGKFFLETEEEVEATAEKIRSKTYYNEADLSISMKQLGQANAVHHAKLIEGYLDYKECPFVAASALEVLFEDFNLTQEYMPYVKKCLRGFDWDYIWDLQLKAIYCAGQYLHYDHFDKELLQILVEVFENPNQDPVPRAKALESIALAKGICLMDTPPLSSTELSIEENRFDLIDLSILDWAHKKLKED